MSLTPHEQLAIEIRSVLNRWIEESDLDPDVLADVAIAAVESWLDGPTIGFDPDFDVDGAS